LRRPPGKKRALGREHAQKRTSLGQNGETLPDAPMIEKPCEHAAQM
jgi:hypothetical protein